MRRPAATSRRARQGPPGRNRTTPPSDITMRSAWRMTAAALAFAARGPALAQHEEDSRVADTGQAVGFRDNEGPRIDPRAQLRKAFAQVSGRLRAQKTLSAPLWSIRAVSLPAAAPVSSSMHHWPSRVHAPQPLPPRAHGPTPSLTVVTLTPTTGNSPLNRAMTAQARVVFPAFLPSAPRRSIALPGRTLLPRRHDLVPAWKPIPQWRNRFRRLSRHLPRYAQMPRSTMAAVRT